MEAPLHLSGTWALEMVVASTARAPIFGDVKSASRSRMLVHLAQDGGGWTQRQEVCTTALEGGSKLAKTILPPAWVSAMPPRSYTVTFTAAPDGWIYAADTGVQVLGFDESRGPMPSRGTDPQVVDADRDGRPGATVLVQVPGFGNGEVYVAHRGHSRLEGRVVNGDFIQGNVVVLASSQATLGASHKVFDFSPVTRPDPPRSIFVMWRVGAGPDCDSIRRMPSRIPTTPSAPG